MYLVDGNINLCYSVLTPRKTWYNCATLDLYEISVYFQNEETARRTSLYIYHGSPLSNSLPTLHTDIQIVRVMNFKS